MIPLKEKVSLDTEAWICGGEWHHRTDQRAGVMVMGKDFRITEVE